MALDGPIFQQAISTVKEAIEADTAGEHVRAPAGIIDAWPSRFDASGRG